WRRQEIAGTSAIPERFPPTGHFRIVRKKRAAGSARAERSVMVTEKQLAANRRNGFKSTGPKSPEGKARVAQNGTTYGIFCRHLLLAGERAEEFELFR